MSMHSQRFPLRGEWVIAAFDIAVCADESGIHEGAKVCILAGYIGSVRQWVQFEHQWESVLKKYDVNDFHSKNFFAFDPRGNRVGTYRLQSDKSQKRSYSEWSDDKCANFIAELLQVIHNRNALPVGASVDIPAFFALTYGERKFLTGGLFDGKTWLSSGAPSKPYFTLFQHCIVDAANKTKPGKRVAFIFDKQDEYKSRALATFGEVYQHAEADIRSKMYGALYVPREEASGLQAADLYTHCWYRYREQPEKLGSLRGDVLDVLTIKSKGIGVYNAAHFEFMLSKLPAAVRNAIRSTHDPTEERQ